MHISTLNHIVFLLCYTLIYSDNIHSTTKEVICEISCNFKKILQKDCDCAKIYAKDWTAEDYLPTPKLLCKTDNMISFKWNYSKFYNHSYVAEVRTHQLEWFYTKQSLNDNTLTIHELESNTSYRVRCWIILSNGDIYGPVVLLWVTTAYEYSSPLPIQAIHLKHIYYRKNYCDAIIEWTPSKDLSCYYSFVWYGESMEHDYNELHVTDPSTLYKVKIDTLKYDHNYTVIARAKSSLNIDVESEPAEMIVSTLPCLRVHNNLSICPPEKPEGLLVEETLVDKSENVSVMDFKISWSKPSLIPDGYSIHYISLSINVNSSGLNFNVTGDNTKAYIKSVQVRYYYQISIRAWSTGGWSFPENYYGEIKDTVGNIQSDLTTIITIVVGGLCLICFVILLTFFANHQHGKRKRANRRSEYFQELEQNIPPSIENILVEFTLKDKWILDSNNILLQSVLGQGAFGTVRHGMLNKDGISIEVAIKMLKDSPSVEELRHFQQEIEIMKSVGSHPHIVSLLGCCVKTGFGPLLIVEYCSMGNLQTYLQSAWDRMTVNAPESQYEIPSSSIPTDEYRTNFSNKMYDLCDINIDKDLLQPKDLLSFARQIAMGMEYLSHLRILHRDLAARNILVCQDKTVKVSDFGLSRDVYQDNIYNKRVGGKLPIRWMAIESLTHQQYTTKSDVWSFGILLWEIVNLGACPYPGVANCDIPQFLKNGYRMERPNNCHSDIYNIMLNCWKMSPKDRPTFKELREYLEQLLETETQYIQLDADSFVDRKPMVSNSTKLIPRHSERYVKPLTITR